MISAYEPLAGAFASAGDAAEGVAFGLDGAAVLNGGREANFEAEGTDADAAVPRYGAGFLEPGRDDREGGAADVGLLDPGDELSFRGSLLRASSRPPSALRFGGAVPLLIPFAAVASFFVI
jgi:hypothetical protein